MRLSEATRTASAAVLRAIDAPLEVSELELREPRDGEVVVAVEYGGICGTDVHLCAGDLPVPVPLVLGHEGIGVIEEAGAGARMSDGSVATAGRRVMWASSVSCGACWPCRVAREPTLCEHRRTYGVNRSIADGNGPAGSWSRRILLERGTSIVAVPDGVDSLAASALACAGPTVLHALDERRPIRRGESVVVQGSGPVGIAAAVYAGLSGADPIVLVGAPAVRLELAAELGIGSAHVDFTETDQLVEHVVGLTPDGRGADLVIECTGVPDAVEQGLRMCRRGGSYLVLGQYTDAGPAAINPHSVVYRQLDVVGSWAFGGPHLERYAASLPRVLRFHALDRLVTVFDLADVNRALTAVKAGAVVKAVLAP
jgi:threonine dehydrogenase-like Zn-dependent dehydrogenase